MNIERINATADAIETRAIAGLGFNMNYFRAAASPAKDKTGNGCGTVACIAGWAMSLAELEGEHLSDGGLRSVAEWLDIDYDKDGRKLFYAANHPLASKGTELGLRCGPLEDITDVQAVRTLRHFATTGIVDWTA